MKKLLLILLLIFLYVSALFPQIEAKLIAQNFDKPVYIKSYPGFNNRLLVVQQDGIIKIIENNTVLKIPFLDKLCIEICFGIISKYSPILSNKISSTLILLSISEAIFNATRCAPPARKSGNITINFFSGIYKLKNNLGGPFNAQYQKIPIGSYGIIRNKKIFHKLKSLSLSVFIFPTLLKRSRKQVILSRKNNNGFELFINNEDKIQFNINNYNIKLKKKIFEKKIISKN